MATLRTKNKNAIYQSAKRNFYAQMNAYVQNSYINFYESGKKLDETLKKDPTLFDRLLNYHQIKIATTFDLYASIIGGVVDFGVGLFQLGTNFFDNVEDIFDPNDGTKWQEDLAFTLASLPADIIKGIGTAGISVAAGAASMFGVDTDWAFGEDGAQRSLEKFANEKIIGSALQAADLQTDRFMAFSKSQTGQYDNESIKQYIDDKWDPNEVTSKMIQGSAAFSQWTKRNLDKTLGSVFDKAIAERGTAGSKLYQKFLEPIAGSIGRIIPAVALNVVSKGASSAQLAAAINSLAKIYFVSNVYGGATSEAIENGASFNDAHLYGLSSALLETGTEYLGGFIPGGDNVVKNLLGVLKNAGTEGIEEFIAELAQPGLEYWLSESRTVDKIDGGEMLSKALYSFAMGAVSGGVFGAVGLAQTSRSPEAQLQLFRQEFEKGNMNPKEVKKRVEKALELVNTQNIPQWRKDAIINSGVFELLYEADVTTETPVIDMGRGTTETTPRTDSTYKLSEIGQRIVNNDIFSKQGDVVITKEDFATGSQEFFIDYLDEIETVPDGSTVPFKTKIKILTNQELDTKVDAENKATFNEMKKQNLKVVLVKKVGRGGVNFNAFTDTRTGVIYINANSPENIRNGFRSVFAHEMNDKMSLMVEAGLVSQKMFKAYVNFVDKIEKGNFESVLSMIGYSDKPYVRQMATPEQLERADAQGPDGWKNIELTDAQKKVLATERVSAVIERVFDNETIMRKVFGKNPSLLKSIANIFVKAEDFKTQIPIDNPAINKMLNNMQKNFQKLLIEGRNFAYGFENVGQFLKAQIAIDPRLLFSYSIPTQGTNLYADSYSDVLKALDDETAMRKVIGLDVDSQLVQEETRLFNENPALFKMQTERTNPKNIKKIARLNMINDGVEFLSKNNQKKKDLDRINGGNYFLRIGNKYYDKNKFVIPDRVDPNSKIIINFKDNTVFEISYERIAPTDMAQPYVALFEEAASYAGFDTTIVFPDALLPDGRIIKDAQVGIFSMNPGALKDMMKTDEGKLFSQSVAIASFGNHKTVTQVFERLFQDNGHAFTMSAVLNPESFNKPGVAIFAGDSFTPIRIFKENVFKNEEGVKIDGSEIFKDLGADPTQEIVLRTDTAALAPGTNFEAEYAVAKKNDPIEILRLSLQLSLDRIDAELMQENIVDNFDSKVDLNQVTNNVGFILLELSKMANNIYANEKSNNVDNLRNFKDRIGKVSPPYAEVVRMAKDSGQALLNIFEGSSLNGRVDFFTIGQALSIAMNGNLEQSFEDLSRQSELQEEGAVFEDGPISYNEGLQGYDMYVEFIDDFQVIAEFMRTFQQKPHDTVIEGKISSLDIAQDVAAINFNHIGPKTDSKLFTEIKEYFESRGVAVTQTHQKISMNVAHKTYLEKAPGRVRNETFESINDNFEIVYNTNNSYFNYAFSEYSVQNATQSPAQALAKAALERGKVFSYEIKETKNPKPRKKSIETQPKNLQEQQEINSSETETTVKKFNQKKLVQTSTKPTTAIPVEESNNVDDFFSPQEIRRANIEKVDALKNKKDSLRIQRLQALEDGNAEKLRTIVKEMAIVQVEIDFYEAKITGSERVIEQQPLEQIYTEEEVDVLSQAPQAEEGSEAPKPQVAVLKEPVKLSNDDFINFSTFVQKEVFPNDFFEEFPIEDQNFFKRIRRDKLVIEFMYYSAVVLNEEFGANEGNMTEIKPSVKDWLSFSRARGYTEQQIANFQKRLEIYDRLIKRYKPEDFNDFDNPITQELVYDYFYGEGSYIDKNDSILPQGVQQQRPDVEDLSEGQQPEITTPTQAEDLSEGQQLPDDGGDNMEFNSDEEALEVRQQRNERTAQQEAIIPDDGRFPDIDVTLTPEQEAARLDRIDELEQEGAIFQEEIVEAAVEVDEFVKMKDIAMRQNKVSYRNIERSFIDFSENIYKDVEARRDTDFLEIVSIFRRHEGVIRKNVRGKLYINHFSEVVLKALVQELSIIKLNIANAEGRTDLKLTPAEIQSVVQKVYAAMFSSMIHMEDITSSQYVTEDNPTGKIYNRFTHRFLRELMTADLSNPEILQRFNNDGRGDFLRRLVNAIYNINEENGFKELMGAINEMVVTTEVDKVNVLSLNPDGTLRTHTKVKAEWSRNAEQIRFISDSINYSILLPKLIIKGKRFASYNSVVDPYTFLNIQSLSNEFGWGNVLMGKIEEGVARQIEVDRVFEETLQDKDFLRNNIRELKSFENEKKGYNIRNLNGARLSMSHIIYLRAVMMREIVRNRAIDAGIILGKKSTHFNNGNTLVFLNVSDEAQIKADYGKKVKIVSNVELLNELDAVLQGNQTAVELNQRVSDFMFRLYPSINERYSEINGEPLKSEGIEIAEAIAQDGTLADVLFADLPDSINAENVERLYMPLSVGKAGYFKEDSVSLRDILDLGVSDGFTQEIGSSNAVVEIDSVINVVYKYKKETRNYIGLHRIMEHWNILVNEKLDLTPRDILAGNIQDKNMKEYITQEAVDYVENYLKDLAGYGKGFNIPGLTVLRKNFYRHVLGANIKSILSQLTTIYNLSTIYGDSPMFFTKMYKNLFMQLSPKNKEKVKNLRDSDNIVWDRSNMGTFDIGEATTQGFVGNDGFNKVVNLLMSGMQITDNAVNNAFYLTLLETTNPDTDSLYTPEEARKITRKGILRSQSSALDLSKAPLLRSKNEVIRMMVKFTGEPLKLQTQIYNSKKELELIRKLQKRDKNGVDNIQKIQEQLAQLEAQALQTLEAATAELQRLQAMEDSVDFATLENSEQKQIRKNIELQKIVVNEAVELFNDVSSYARSTYQQIENIVARKPKTKEMLVRQISAFIGTMIYMAALNVGWGLLLKDLGNLDDREEEEELSQYITRKFGSAMAAEFFGFFPFIRDIYGLIAEGYDIDTIDELSLLQETILLVANIVEKTSNGEAIPIPELIRDITIFGGRTFGLPTKNLENIMISALMISDNKDVYYRYRAVTGQRTASNKELEQAIREGNDDLVQAIVETKLASRQVFVSDNTTDEIIRLAKVGKDVSITGIYDVYKIDGVEYKLEESQKKRFKEIYNQADFIIQKLITTSAYKRLSDDKKASILRSIYTYYLKLAQSDAFDLDLVPENRTFRTLNQAFAYFRDTVAPSLFEKEKREKIKEKEDERKKLMKSLRG